MKILHVYLRPTMKKTKKILLSWHLLVELHFGAREPDLLCARSPSAFSVAPRRLSPGDASCRSLQEKPVSFLGLVSSREIVGASVEKTPASVPHLARTTVFASCRERPKVAFSSLPPVNVKDASSFPLLEKAMAVVSFHPPEKVKAAFSSLPLETVTVASSSLPPGTAKAAAFFQLEERPPLFSACPRQATVMASTFRQRETSSASFQRVTG